MTLQEAEHQIHETPQHDEHHHRPESNGHDHHESMMQKTAQQVSAHYLTHSELADDVVPELFPGPVMAGLRAGALIGAALGVILGYLMLTNVITIPGWEGLYSMGGPAFLTFWGGVGVATGIIVVGIGTLFAVQRRHDTP